jgi:hypothetical protein
MLNSFSKSRLHTERDWMNNSSGILEKVQKLIEN